jgi:superfamily II DNA or RNA helicase
LQRKKDRCREYHSDGRIELLRRIKTVKKVSYEEAQCIMVDSENHLYITDDYVVTHNTIMNAALVDVYAKHNPNIKTITIVPSSDLVLQTKEDFMFWGLDTGEYSGDLKDIDHTHVISTWQALQKNGTLMKEFDLVVVDEAHGLKGQVLTKLLNENGNHIVHRFGLTGTLPKPATDKMAVHISVGNVHYEISAADLIKQGWLAKLDIDIMQINEDLKAKFVKFKEENKLDSAAQKMTYNQFKDKYFGEYSAEKSYLQTCKPRIEYIADILIDKQSQKKGNVFCLVDGVAFGKKLTKLIPGAIFVHGKDKKKARKEVYDLFKENDNMVVIATVQVASTGLNIKRIFNLVFVDMGKSFIRVIQTIGRGLRKAPDKDYVLVTDISSDLKYGKRHVRERMNFYRDAEYPHKKRVVSYADSEQLTKFTS